MLRRILLALTFVAALGAAGFGMSGTAEAAHGCGGYSGGYGGGYGGYGYRAYYPSSYYGYGYGYGPRVSHYRSYDHGHYDHHDRGHGGVSFSFGF